MQQIRPDYAAADYYLALAKAWAGETDDAVVLFKQALRKETNQETQETYTHRFLQAMARPATRCLLTPWRRTRAERFA